MVKAAAFGQVREDKNVFLLRFLEMLSTTSQHKYFWGNADAWVFMSMYCMYCRHWREAEQGNASMTEIQ